jgi:hypothetical protein
MSSKSKSKFHCQIISPASISKNWSRLLMLVVTVSLNKMNS